MMKQRRLAMLDTKGIPVARKVCVLDKSLILTPYDKVGEKPVINTMLFVLD